jgi:hypothetical protein
MSEDIATFMLTVAVSMYGLSCLAVGYWIGRMERKS